MIKLSAVLSVRQYLLIRAEPGFTEVKKHILHILGIDSQFKANSINFGDRLLGSAQVDIQEDRLPRAKLGSGRDGKKVIS